MARRGLCARRHINPWRAPSRGTAPARRSPIAETGLVGHDLDTIVTSNRGRKGEMAHPWRDSSMLSLIRAGVFAALLLVPFAAGAAEKPFQNGDLADAAIALEAQIKSDAGAPTEPLAQIRHDADAAFSKNDFRAGMALLGQIVAAAPSDATTWLRLAHTIMQIGPANDAERT